MIYLHICKKKCTFAADLWKNWQFRMKFNLFNTRSIRELWYDYRSEFVFGAVLLLMMVVSFFVGTLFSEQLMDAIIIPLEYIGTLAVCFFGAFLLFRHQEDNNTDV